MIQDEHIHTSRAPSNGLRQRQEQQRQERQRRANPGWRAAPLHMHWLLAATPSASCQCTLLNTTQIHNRGSSQPFSARCRPGIQAGTAARRARGAAAQRSATAPVVRPALSVAPGFITTLTQPSALSLNMLRGGAGRGRSAGVGDGSLAGRPALQAEQAVHRPCLPLPACPPDCWPRRPPRAPLTGTPLLPAPAAGGG